MTQMNLEDAFKNIDTLIANSRLNRQEHVTLQQSLQMLYTKAKDNEAAPEGEPDATAN